MKSMKEKVIVYKKYTIYRTNIEIYFVNGKTERLLQIHDKKGNIIHRACQWGDYSYTLSDAKQRINKHIKILQENEAYFQTLTKKGE